MSWSDPTKHTAVNSELEEDKPKHPCAMKPTQRVRVLKIELDLLVGVLSEDGVMASEDHVLRIYRDALPEGTECVRAYIDHTYGSPMLCMMLRHPSFDPVESGGVPGELRSPQLMRHNKPDWVQEPE